MNGRSERDPLTLGRIALHCRPGDDCRATDAGVAQLAGRQSFPGTRRQRHRRSAELLRDLSHGALACIACSYASMCVQTTLAGVRRYAPSAISPLWCAVRARPGQVDAFAEEFEALGLSHHLRFSAPLILHEPTAARPNATTAKALSACAATSPVRRVNTHPFSPSAMDAADVDGSTQTLKPGTRPLLRCEHMHECPHSGLVARDLDVSSENLLQALSHFSWEASAGSMLLVFDTVGSSHVRPSVHTTAAGPDLGAGNMGRAAIEMFLRSHECNEHCAHWQEAWTGNMTPTDMRRRRALLRERQHTAGKMAADMARRVAAEAAAADSLPGNDDDEEVKLRCVPALMPRRRRCSVDDGKVEGSAERGAGTESCEAIKLGSQPNSDRGGRSRSSSSSG